MTPKNIHKIFIPPKIFSFLKTPKIIKIQNFEPQKIARAYVPRGTNGQRDLNEESPFFSNLKFQTSLFLFGTSHKSACKLLLPDQRALED